jgi:uncharacterized protein (DUF58 family)
LLASEIIRRVREIQVRTGRQVADVLAGEYVSVFKGGGIEFEEVRPYVPGDDIRSIDWNVTARTGEPFVKRYVEERQLTLMLVADVSASQEFGSAGRSKREATAELCALLAFSAIRNDDKVGLALFHGDIETFIPPRKGQKHALRVVREVLAHEDSGNGARRARRRTRNADATGGGTGSEPAASTVAEATKARTGMAARTDSIVDAARNRPARGAASARWLSGLFRRRLRRLRAANQDTSIARAMEFVLSVNKRRSVVFVVSDFLDENFERALMTANAKHDVIAVLVTDPHELDVPNVGMVALADAESGRTALYDTGSGAFRRELARMARTRVESLEKRLRSVGIDFIHVDAAGDPVDPLVRFFRMREKRMRR